MHKVYVHLKTKLCAKQAHTVKITDKTLSGFVIYHQCTYITIILFKVCKFLQNTVFHSEQLTFYHTYSQSVLHDIHDKSAGKQQNLLLLSLCSNKQTTMMVMQ